jgi:hypothetical protein
MATNSIEFFNSIGQSETSRTKFSTSASRLKADITRLAGDFSNGPILLQKSVANRAE